MEVVGGGVGVVHISTRINDVKLLQDTRFCTSNATESSTMTCDGKYVRFAVQGSECSTEYVQYHLQRGGKIVWLSKDIRGCLGHNDALHAMDNSSRVSALFLQALTQVSGVEERHDIPITPTTLHSTDDGIEEDNTPAARPIVVSLDMGVMMNAGGTNNTSNSMIGLSIDEILNIAQLAGANPNVSRFYDIILPMCGSFLLSGM